MTILGVGSAVTENTELAGVWEEAASGASAAVSAAYDRAYAEAGAKAREALCSAILEQGDDPAAVRVLADTVIRLNGSAAPDTVSISSHTVCECLAAYGVISRYADTSGVYSDPADTGWNDMAGQDGEEFPSFIRLMKEYASGMFAAGSCECRVERQFDDSRGATYTGFASCEIIRRESGFMPSQRETAIKAICSSDSLSREEAEKKLEEEIVSSLEALTAQFSGGSVKISREKLYQNVMSLPSYPLFSAPCPTLVPPFSWDTVTAWFGPRTLRGKYNYHTGIDFGRKRGTPVYPAAAGLVVFAYDGCHTDNDPSGGYGNYVIIYHGRRDGRDIYTLYGHLQSVEVREGERAWPSMRIGTVGSRGNSTGPHLHWEVNTYDPSSGEARSEDPKEFT